MSKSIFDNPRIIELMSGVAEQATKLAEQGISRDEAIKELEKRFGGQLPQTFMVAFNAAYIVHEEGSA